MLPDRPVRALVVDDDQAACDLLRDGLERRECTVAIATSAPAALEAIGTFEPDVVLSDLHMKGMGGLDLCARIAERWPRLPVIVVTAFGSLETAVGAIRAGAYDFVTKPFELDAIALAVTRAARHHALAQEVARLRDEVAARARPEEILGESHAVKALLATLARVAPTDATVMITGESGTGKELVARALHRLGPRREGPFVALNCAAVPEALLESELFGHARGAFTDARAARRGLLAEADGGTLFLDEIGDLALHLQPKLLRALQERRVRPVGGEAEVPFDVRVIAATNRDLVAAVEEGRFREDLYYRVNVVHLECPPLRARGGDVLMLAQRFVEQFARSFQRNVKGLSPEAAARLMAYDWPGNVRELQNCMERAVALARGDEVVPDDLPERVLRHQTRSVVLAAQAPAEILPLDQVERQYVCAALGALGGNKTLAAQRLGIDRKTLYRMLQRWGAVGG